MSLIKQKILPMGGAVIVTSVLTFTMISMINVEFEALPEREKIDFKLVEITEDPVIRTRETQIEPLKVVIPPPEIMPLETQEVSEPTIPSTVSTELPTLPRPVMGDVITDVVYTDDTMIPILRVPPRMPARAERSGHCDMVFDVGPDGATLNVKASYCSEALFETESIRATLKFKYRPTRIDGQYQTTRNVKTRIKFKLQDQNGNLIPAM